MSDVLFPAGMERTATLSDCGRYRYALGRRWEEPCTGVANFIMLNPSTADDKNDDPTIRRCIGFARSWGYDALVVTNLYALRATDPAQLWKVARAERVGLGNDGIVLDEASRATVVVCAWGAHGAKFDRGGVLLRMLARAGVPTYRLAMTRGGQPAHPLYLPADLHPLPLESPCPL